MAFIDYKNPYLKAMPIAILVSILLGLITSLFFAFIDLFNPPELELQTLNRFIIHSIFIMLFSLIIATPIIFFATLFGLYLTQKNRWGERWSVWTGSGAFIGFLMGLIFLMGGYNDSYPITIIMVIQGTISAALTRYFAAKWCFTDFYN